MSDWTLDMVAEPVVPAWHVRGHVGQNGAELQWAILKGFSACEVLEKGFTFEKTFTFKEHGEFFRGALTMASLRYTGDFYDLLQRYGSIKVTIVKAKKEQDGQ